MCCSIPKPNLISQSLSEFIPFTCHFQWRVNHRGNNIQAPVWPRGALNYSPCQRSAFSTQTNTAFPKWKLSEASSNTHKTVLAANANRPGAVQTLKSVRIYCVFQIVQPGARESQTGLRSACLCRVSRLPNSERPSACESILCVNAECRVSKIRSASPRRITSSGQMAGVVWPLSPQIYSKGHLIFSHKKL